MIKNREQRKRQRIYKVEKRQSQRQRQSMSRVWEEYEKWKKKIMRNRVDSRERYKGDENEQT